MDTLAVLQKEVRDLRRQIEHASCSTQTAALSKAQTILAKQIQNLYGGSIVMFISCSFLLIIVMCVCAWLLYNSLKRLSERYALKRLLGEMRRHPVVAEELKDRVFTQASRRAAHRFGIFFVVIKCIIGSSVVFCFLGMRLMMELAFHGWLRDALLSPGPKGSTSFSENSSGYGQYVREELYAGIVSLLGAGWFRDLQSLLISSTIGTTVLVFGLQLMKSAAAVAMDLAKTRPASQIINRLDERCSRRMQNHLQSIFSQLIGVSGGPELCGLASRVTDGLEASDKEQVESEDNTDETDDKSNETKEKQ
ncbi:hypothetical protein ERJ75_000982900 [Trypanosoma vivax]|uniref:Uncharacterized protein n=1 Tax=Trypanosoma vivax (strain Y486) TaxID=1055687 RepID=G0U6X6_TRYVY|nr:hypothetical protein TRVL_02815 [Trypanosoma vivax]KAH8611398.1 hypothetical protein ERJ75_000982900 [Trypanosoma vivax]CCC51633.1 conserved hypothetical protein [Trypanosoma vivax Y486]